MVLSYVAIDGRASGENTVQVWGDGVTLSHDWISNGGRGRSCVYLGSREFGTASGPRVIRNHIHDCGSSNLDHGIYADSVRGGLIADNAIYDVPGWGMQLYKDADRLRITHNVFDDAKESGLLISGDDDEGTCYTSDGNRITYNIFSFNAQYGVDEWWGCSHGKGNLVERNCFWRNTDGLFDTAFQGYRQRANRVANPRFVNRARGDFRLGRRSGCAGTGPRSRR